MIEEGGAECVKTALSYSSPIITFPEEVLIR